MRIQFAILSVLILAACTDGVMPSNIDGVKVSDDTMVKKCKFLGDVTGLSGISGVFSGDAYATSREFAADEAKKLGATNIVFAGGSSQQFAGVKTVGKAYKCGN